MIPFFRKIRQSLLKEKKVTRYLIYAVGEILLVVIGILIALQINNANEASKTEQAEQVVLTNLVQDLRADSTSFSESLAQLTMINDLHQVLYEIGVNGKVMEIENPNLIRFLIYYHPLALKNDPLVINKISKEGIRKEMLTYSKHLKDLDDTYFEFEELIRDRIRIFLGDEKVHNLSSLFGNPSFEDKGVLLEDFIDKADLILLSKTPEFQQLIFEASIKTKNTELNMRQVLEQNTELKKVILREIKK